MTDNVARRVLGGVGSNHLDLQRGTRAGNPPGFYKAVVVDVVCDVESYSDAEREDLKQKLNNPEFVDSMPENSVIARVINDGQDLTNSKPSLFYPLFSSHFSLPVNPGEQVTIVYEDFQQHGLNLGRWITRTRENEQVEDPNYTHGDRRYDPELLAPSQRTSVQATTTRSTPVVASFPNGTGVEGGYTLSQTNSDNPYNKILEKSRVRNLVTFEPVPRWIKRPQELVIQGSNNTVLVLGEDRTGPAIRVSGSDQQDRSGYAGTIDMVCGRGRNNLPYSEESTLRPSDTCPVVIRNTRGKLETDKTPRKRNRTRNPKEGQPDFIKDAARIYLSMNTLGDKNFGLVRDFYPTNVLKPEQLPANNTGIGNSYVIQKADNIRIIGRKETNPTINGSVLILKEGTKDEDLSYIFLDRTGKIQLEASEIFLGQSTEKTDPYIKFSVYKEHIRELKTQIKTLADQVQAITTAYNSAFQLSIAIPLIPIATLANTGPTVQTQTTAVVGAIKTAVDTINADDAKSEKIFGE